MAKYVVSTHDIKPEELFSKLEGLERVVVLSSNKIGDDVGIAEIESGISIDDIYQQLGYDRAKVIIGPIRTYKTC